MTRSPTARRWIVVSSASIVVLAAVVVATRSPDAGESAATTVEAPDAAPTSPAVDHLGRLLPALDADEARQVLETLPVLAEHQAGYEREEFGPAWSDVDGNGCNQRDDVLVRDAVAGTVMVGQQGACDHDVLAGQWVDPYTGTLLTFDDLKEPQQAEAIPIDHLVPLGEAYRSGAYGWTPERREGFANDLGNLVAVGGSANSSKSDSDPAGWLPPPGVQCDYVRVWVAVKQRWQLSVDPAEGAELTSVLDGC